jgi:hypothetical protein
MRIRRNAIAGMIALLLSSAAAANEPPALHLELTPRAQAGSVDLVQVNLRLQAPNVKAGELLLRMPINLAGMPTAAYSAEDILAEDDGGPLALRALDEPANPSGRHRQYLVSRDTKGDVRVRYAGKPRVVDAQTRNGPLFDLRSEAGGALGAGVYFLALPPEKQVYRISLKWDLSQLPAGARGVWSLGEGEQRTVGPAEMLRFSLYAMGPVKSEPSEGKGNFGLYWLSPPPFDMPKLAADTQKLYRYMATFFDDTKSSYRVFARRNPYPAGGGTALAKSFVFGYGPNGESASTKDNQMLLAHEMAHNWPRMNGNDDHAGTAWYSEGTAEYYSAVLSYRAGVIGLDKFVKSINSMAADYASNPHKNLSNDESGKIFWTDSRAQRVPYGRGFMYLARLNAQLKAKADKQRSLDDLVLEVQARQRAGKQVGLAEWREMVTRELGPAAAAELDAMIAGKDIAPLPGAFGPCLKPVAYQLRPFDLGFDEMSLGVVKNLRAGSAAAAAGVKEGDQIVMAPDLVTAKDSDDRPLKLDVKRGEQRLTISYIPRGAAVPAWRWERTADAAKGACKL